MRGCGLLITTLALAACSGGRDPTPSPTPSPGPTPDPDPVIAAAGDIACGSASPRTAPCRQFETSELLVEIRPSAVLALGDIQYEFGQYQDFLRYYDPSWGRLKPITRPAPGNHEYETREASGYFDYFIGPGRTTSVLGNRGEGWYSFDVGSWHLISLNSNCSFVGGCGAGSRQVAWLRADLQANRAATCTLAYWHHPRYSSGKSRDDRTYQPFWDALYEANADIVLVSHDHHYERFAPMNANGQADSARGIRQFIVGTGGHSFQPLGPTLPNSEVRDGNTFGVIRMRLRPGRYEWAFQPIPGSTFTDSGSGTCH